MDQKSINDKSKMLTLGILSISFLMSVSNAVSGTIPMMEKHFSNISQANIELLIVIPTGGVLLGTVVSGLVSNRIGKKNTVLLGLAISMLFGIIPAFYNSYLSVLISRAVFGVGMGIFTPLSVSYITDTFSEDKRNKLLGWRNSIGAIGDAIMLFIASFLIQISWNATYLVFLFLIVPIVLVALFVPRELDQIALVAEDAGAPVDTTVKPKPETNFGVIQLAGLFLLMCLFYSAISLKLPSLVVNSGLGTPAQVTYIFSFLVLCSIFSGVTFNYIAKLFGKYTVFAFEMITAIAMIMLPFVNSIPMLLVLVLICGFSNGVINPALTSRMVSYSPAGSMNFTTSIIIIGINIGFLTAPYVFQFMGKLLGNGSPEAIIIASGVAYVLLAVYDLIVVKKDKLSI